MINLLLLYNNEHRMFFRSGLHAQKQLYFSSTRIIPNSPNADMRCQLSYNICRLYTHSLSHYQWYLQVLSCTGSLNFYVLSLDHLLLFFSLSFFFFKCIWGTLPQYKSKHCLLTYSAYSGHKKATDPLEPELHNSVRWTEPGNRKNNNCSKLLNHLSSPLCTVT